MNDSVVKPFHEVLADIRKARYVSKYGSPPEIRTPEEYADTIPEIRRKFKPLTQLDMQNLYTNSYGFYESGVTFPDRGSLGVLIALLKPNTTEMAALSLSYSEMEKEKRPSWEDRELTIPNPRRIVNWPDRVAYREPLVTPEQQMKLRSYYAYLSNQMPPHEISGALFGYDVLGASKGEMAYAGRLNLALTKCHRSQYMPLISGLGFDSEKDFILGVEALPKSELSTSVTIGSSTEGYVR